MSEQVSPVAAGHHEDAEYSAFLQRVSARFRANTAGRPIFQTAAEGLWELYLGSFPEGPERQHHNCNACRHFIQRFGGLVTIDPDGTTRSAIWNEADAPAAYMPALTAMRRAAEAAKVTGPFLSSEQVWGQPVTGVWQHLHAHNHAVHTDRVETAGQAMAKKRQDFQTLRRGLAEFDKAVVGQAVQLLEANALYRGEKVLGAAKWLLDVHAAREGKEGEQQANVTWLAVAPAPAGFCQPRSSMIGTLLEDIVAGLPVADIQRRFADKMDPQNYQRAQAAPKTGQIEAAERAVDALGIAPAFARRYALAGDFNLPGAVLWCPGVPAARPEVAPKPAAAGVFDHLKPAAAVVPQVDIPPKKMTWEKFTRDVLPGAALIEYRVPLVGRFCALTAAQDLAAPPILQWDSPEQRNTVSWAFPNPPARADEWGLTAGALARVSMIARAPNQWGYENHQFAHHGKGVFLLLEGARDVRGLPGGGLFTEHVRNELKPYRSTIEAHLNRLQVAGADDPATVGFGIGLFDGNEFTEAAAPKLTTRGPGPAPERIHVILVVDDSGSMRSYIHAARSALASLLAAVRVMPGQVDVTFTIFGARATLLTDRAPLAHMEGMEAHMRGDSGGTALNDTLIDAIDRALSWPDASSQGTSFFLGIVTDGEENQSRRSVHAAREAVSRVNATGRWTVAYAGAGSNPRSYARQVGIPDGNVTVFEASARGFEDVGARYAASTVSLAHSYASGARASTSFFAAAAGRQAIGSDHPVLVVTSKSGGKSAYELDRWD